MFPTNLKLMNILPIPECFHCVIPQGERTSKVKKNLTACRKKQEVGRQQYVGRRIESICYKLWEDFLCKLITTHENKNSLR